jgi:peptidoglycan/xylan/chitin deacetylase (PgdA/CDA1 family)
MSLRHAARFVIDRAAALAGVLGAYQRGMSDGLTVLMYHRVLPDQRCPGYHLPSLAMPLSAFRAQMRYLAVHCRVVTVTQGLELLGRNVDHRPALVSITFDDGYADNYAIAAPILEEYGMRGTFYVTTSLVGTDRRLWFDEAAIRWRGLDWRQVTEVVDCVTPSAILPPSASTSLPDWMAFLKSLATDQRLRLLDALGAHISEAPDDLDRIMTEQELVHLVQRGHEIGSHSATHPPLPQLTDAQLNEELVVSAQHLTSWLGSRPQAFCYPNGDLDDRVVSAVRCAGYLHACTTQTGRNLPSQDPFRLLRIDMNPRRLLHAGVHDELAMRSEISLMHSALR